MRLQSTQQTSALTARRLLECNQPCTDRKCHVALKQRKALNFAFTPSHIQQSRRQSLCAMHQSYAVICLISTRKVPRHGLDFRVTASLKSQCKPGVVCSNCGGRNHFTTVCRSPKDYFKRRSSTQPTHALDHAASAEEDSGDDFEHFCLDESVHALPSSASKLFTTLSLSVSGDSFVDVKFQVDSAATCNTLPYHQFKKIGKDSDLPPTSSKLISYSGEAIRPLGKVTLVHQNPQFFMLMDFHVVDLPRKPALLGLPDSSRLSLLHIDSSRVTTQSDQQPDWLAIIESVIASVPDTILVDA